MKASYDNSIDKIPIDYKVELMLLIKSHSCNDGRAWYRFEYEEKLKKRCIYFLVSIDDVTEC